MDLWIYSPSFINVFDFSEQPIYSLLEVFVKDTQR